MAIMKKQVNLFLILVIFVGIAFIAAMSILYKERISSLGNDYLDAADAYAACNDTLEQTLAELSVTRQQLEANVADVGKTVTLFESKQQELEAKEEELAEERREVARLETEIADVRRQLSDYAAALRTRQEEIATLQATIDSLRDDLQQAEAERDACYNQ